MGRVGLLAAQDTARHHCPRHHCPGHHCPRFEPLVIKAARHAEFISASQTYTALVTTALVITALASNRIVMLNLFQHLRHTMPFTTDILSLSDKTI